ncbi:MAG TPA: ATP-dependent DNA ligase, partial [Thermoanaerobaculia bacterium]|nr:ATP-dependent DNA ligase [Thermoanaerobaculia bacterium]
AVLRFARRLGERLSAAYPRQLTMEARIRDRGSRVYLDPFRNAFGQTVVAPFSVRKRPGAPVSTPLRWADVKSGLDPAAFTLATFDKQLRRRDPWEGFFDARQPIASALKAVDRL